MFGKDIGLDLGTSNVIVCLQSKVILNEPSIVAYDIRTDEVLAIGNEAKAMLGKTPGYISKLQLLIYSPTVKFL